MRKEEVEFVDELPPLRSGGKGKWMSRLLQVTKRPGMWALISTQESPHAANNLQSNLKNRGVEMPYPDHVWEFAARGCEVYAIYRGKKRASDAGLRRANQRG